MKVAAVLDESLPERLEQLLQFRAVWVLDTPRNRSVLSRLSETTRASMTWFTAYAGSPEDAFRELFADIEDHHGLFGDAVWDELVVHGLDDWTIAGKVLRESEEFGVEPERTTIRRVFVPTQF